MHWSPISGLPRHNPKFCKGVKTGDSIGLYSVSESTRNLLMLLTKNNYVHTMFFRMRCISFILKLNKIYHFVILNFGFGTLFMYVCYFFVNTNKVILTLACRCLSIKTAHNKHKKRINLDPAQLMQKT